MAYINIKAKWFAENNCGYGGMIEKAWDAATKLVEEKFTSTNTASTPCDSDGCKNIAEHHFCDECFDGYQQ